MMHCSKAVGQLQLYLDKELTLEQMRALEAHISFCTACQHELFALERLDQLLRRIEPVTEPANLTSNIMLRVAMSPRRGEHSATLFLRPTFSELMAAVCLATVATLGVILGQPSLRTILPFANVLSITLSNFWTTMVGPNTGTLMLGFWILGAALGVWITLAFVGNEMRSQWFKAVMDRLPVW